MFLGDGDCPRASPTKGVADAATPGLLIDAREAISELWRAREHDIKAACAPLQIDEMDCYGYLLADLLGKPLLHSDDAGDVGKRAHVKQKRAAADIKKAERAGSKKLGKIRAGTDASLIEKARQAVAEQLHELRNAPYDLQLPSYCAGKRKKPAGAPPPPPHVR